MKFYASVLLGVALIIAPLTASARDMMVIDPPTNIRDRPNGYVLCKVYDRQPIRVFGRQGDWYVTDYCGSTGVVHASQVRHMRRPPPPRYDRDRDYGSGHRDRPWHRDRPPRGDW